DMILTEETIDALFKDDLVELADGIAVSIVGVITLLCFAASGNSRQMVSKYLSAHLL
ncbi:hypothetical protein LCGC14_2685660, partial [marine sediment metagenome]